VGADDLSVGFVVCAFPKKTKQRTQLCVCMSVCVCGFWVHSQAELLIIGAFNGMVHSINGCTGSSSLTVASFFPSPF
jgi:hypothetical protein